MSTLAKEGFIVQDEVSRVYRLGLPVLSLSTTLKVTNEVLQEAGPVLKSLVNRVGETAQLVVLDQLDVFYFDVVECNYPIRHVSRVGTRGPSYCTSSGKVLLAAQDADVINQVIGEGLAPLTKNTITNPNAFRAELKKIREQGYAISAEERYQGVMAAAAPVYDRNGNIVAAVNIVGPSHRMVPRNLSYFAHHAMRAASEIGRNLHL